MEKEDLSYIVDEHHTGRFLVSNKAKHNINIRSSSSYSFKHLHNRFKNYIHKALLIKLWPLFFIIYKKKKKMEATKWSFDR